MSTEVAIKSAIAEWESRSTAVKLMIRSMVRSKIDMNTAAANRAKREEKKREKNELAAKKRQEMRKQSVSIVSRRRLWRGPSKHPNPWP